MKRNQNRAKKEKAGGGEDKRVCFEIGTTGVRNSSELFLKTKTITLSPRTVYHFLNVQGKGVYVVRLLEDGRHKVSDTSKNGRSSDQTHSRRRKVECGEGGGSTGLEEQEKRVERAEYQGEGVSGCVALPENEEGRGKTKSTIPRVS